MDNLLTQERIDKIFRDRPTADEKREMAEFHRPIYIRLLIMNIPLLIIVIMAIVNYKPYYLFLIGIFLLFDAYIILRLKITPALARKRYIKMVNKYGKDNLIGQIRNPDTRSFIITPDNVDSYCFITPDYLIITQVCIIPLADIKSLTIKPKNYDQALIDRTTKNPEIASDLQNMCDMPVTFKDGTSKNYFIAIRREYIADFLGILKEREEARSRYVY